MPKNGSQNGSVQISTFAGMAIIAAVVVVASAIAVIKYREVSRVSVPVEVVTPEIKPTSDQLFVGSQPFIADEAVGWKTYNNEQYGFEIKYPGNWIINENNDSNPGITLFQVNLNNKALSISINIEGENFMLGTRDWEEFILGQNTGNIACNKVQGNCGNEKGCCEIILDPIKMPTSTTTYITTAKNPFLDPLIEQILSTFKFTK